MFKKASILGLSPLKFLTQWDGLSTITRTRITYKDNTHMASISQRGSKWRAKVRKAGYADQSRTFDTEQEARDWAEQLEEAIDAGKLLVREGADITTFRELVQAYYDLDGHTKEVQENLIQLKLCPLADLMASEITAESVLDWSTERNELTDLAETVIEYARRELGIRLSDNPVRAAFAKPQTMRVRRLASYEEEHLLEEADRTRGGYLKDAILFDLDTALMQAELVNLDWQDVHLDRNEIVVRGRAGDRIIPLTERAKSILASRGCQIKGQVFKGLTAQALQRSFIRCVERAKIADLHFNDLHHEAIFRMKERYSFEEVWRISGVQIASLRRYYDNPSEQV